jgi:LysR family glycine cleavage system transcriptional activator
LDLARRIPPLNPLNVFAAAAKVGNFSAAAEELGVTPSAVSRQIAVLENFLDVQLFHRGVHSNSLTDVGAAYFNEILPAFVMIQNATQNIRDMRVSTPLKLRVLSSFGMRFLIPRIIDFRQKHPEIKLSIDTGFAPADFNNTDVELSIQLGTGNWPGTQSTLLFHNMTQPMWGGRLAKTGHPVQNVEDLRHHSLLYSRNYPSAWTDWAIAKGHPNFDFSKLEMIEFSNSLLMYQAAADGVGIALGQLPLLLPDIENGKLITLLDEPVHYGSYYAVWRSASEPNLKMRKFLAWLNTELKKAFGDDPRQFIRPN